MKKYIGILAAAVLMMTAFSACDAPAPASDTNNTKQEDQTTKAGQEDTSAKEESKGTEAPSVTDEKDADATETPSVSDEAASDDQSNSVKGETDNDSSIRKDIDSIEEMIELGLYDDAQMTINALRTRNLTASQKVEVEKWQKILDEKKK